MRKVLVKICKRIFGPQRIAFFRDYLRFVGPLLLQEYRLITGAIRNCHLDDDCETVMLAELRTKAHILDKSLQNESWQPNHGLHPYQDCRRLIECLKNSNLRSDPSYQWAQEKIKQYERSQANGAIRINTSQQPILDEDNRKLIFKFLKSRRSVRSFLPRTIANNVIEQLIEVVNWAPSSCCRQPVFLHIVRDPDLVQQSLEQCAGASGFSSHIPCFISACADTRLYEARDRHLPLIDVTLGIQNMLLEAHALGLAGTVLNWMHATRQEEKNLRRLLDIPFYHRIIYNIVLGYPSKWPDPPARKSLELTYAYHYSSDVSDKDMHGTGCVNKCYSEGRDSSAALGFASE